MGSGGPTLQNQVIGAYAAAPNGQLFLGEFGVNPQPTNFSTIENGQASFLTSLKDQGMISSLSVGYTAGAPYREWQQYFGNGYMLTRSQRTEEGSWQPYPRRIRCFSIEPQ